MPKNKSDIKTRPSKTNPINDGVKNAKKQQNLEAKEICQQALKSLKTHLNNAQKSLSRDRLFLILYLFSYANSYTDRF